MFVGCRTYRESNKNLVTLGTTAYQVLRTTTYSRYNVLTVSNIMILQALFNFFPPSQLVDVDFSIAFQE